MREMMACSCSPSGVLPEGDRRLVQPEPTRPGPGPPGPAAIATHDCPSSTAISIGLPSRTTVTRMVWPGLGRPRPHEGSCPYILVRNKPARNGLPPRLHLSMTYSLIYERNRDLQIDFSREEC